VPKDWPSVTCAAHGNAIAPISNSATQTDGRIQRKFSFIEASSRFFPASRPNPRVYRPGLVDSTFRVILARRVGQNSFLATSLPPTSLVAGSGWSGSHQDGGRKRVSPSRNHAKPFEDSALTPQQRFAQLKQYLGDPAAAVAKTACRCCRNSKVCLLPSLRPVFAAVPSAESPAPTLGRHVSADPRVGRRTRVMPSRDRR
jgi:hypothetical protein